MIAVDAMGGDNAPRAPILGALHAARLGKKVGLFGDETRIRVELQALDPEWSRLPISIHHCSEVISMGGAPTRSVLKNQESSLIQALRAVVNGHADAVVTAGNSGAALVAGVLILGRVPGIERPALGRFLPSKRGSVFCLDLGVNADCKPEYLVQFALMGQAYVRIFNNNPAPRIGLLSNGHEPYKGSALVKKSYDLLSNLPLYFVGNIEARDIFDDYADVIVSDGFAGNVLLKTAQGTAKAIAYWVEQEGSKTALRRLLMRLFGNSLVAKLYEKTNYAEQAGALLLGLNYPLIIAHGCSTARAIEHSIIEAESLVARGFMQAFNQELMRVLPLAQAPVLVDIARHTQQSSSVVQ